MMNVRRAYVNISYLLRRRYHQVTFDALLFNGFGAIQYRISLLAQANTWSENTHMQE